MAERTRPTFDGQMLKILQGKSAEYSTSLCKVITVSVTTNGLQYKDRHWLEAVKNTRTGESEEQEPIWEVVGVVAKDSKVGPYGDYDDQNKDAHPENASIVLNLQVTSKQYETIYEEALEKPADMANAELDSNNSMNIHKPWQIRSHGELLKGHLQFKTFLCKKCKKAPSDLIPGTQCIGKEIPDPRHLFQHLSPEQYANGFAFPTAYDEDGSEIDFWDLEEGDVVTVGFDMTFYRSQKGLIGFRLRADVVKRHGVIALEMDNEAYVASATGTTPTKKRKLDLRFRRFM